MNVTRKSVMIESTDRDNGALVQGGVCGLVERYDIDDVMELTGMTREELIDAPENMTMPAYAFPTTLREVIEGNLRGHCCRRGVRIA